MPALKPDPLRELLSLQQQIAKRVEERLGVGLGLGSDGAGSPAVDLFELEDSFVLRAELPGVDPKDVALTIEGRVLSLRGTRAPRRAARKSEPPSRVVRPDGNSPAAQEFHRMEREHGAFQRAFTLPRPVDPTTVEERWSNGVLEVRVSKKTSKPSSDRGKRR